MYVSQQENQHLIHKQVWMNKYNWNCVFTCSKPHGLRLVFDGHVSTVCTNHICKFNEQSHTAAQTGHVTNMSALHAFLIVTQLPQVEDFSDSSLNPRVLLHIAHYLDTFSPSEAAFTSTFPTPTSFEIRSFRSDGLNTPDLALWAVSRARIAWDPAGQWALRARFGTHYSSQSSVRKVREGAQWGQTLWINWFGTIQYFKISIGLCLQTHLQPNLETFHLHIRASYTT